MEKTVKAYVYWDDGTSLSSHRQTIFLDYGSETKGQIRDGRPVELKSGKWTYTAR